VAICLSPCETLTVGLRIRSHHLYSCRQLISESAILGIQEVAGVEDRGLLDSDAGRSRELKMGKIPNVENDPAGLTSDSDRSPDRICQVLGFPLAVIHFVAPQQAVAAFNFWRYVR
jgi:hypothetical protein